MKKRILPLLMAIALLLSIMTGCGSTASSAPAATETSVSAETEAPASEQETPEEPEEAREADVAEDSAEAPEEVSVVEEEPFTVEEPTDYTLTDETETLSLWYPAASAFQNMIDYSEHERLKTTEELTNVHIDLQVATTETANQTLNLMVASGDFPDMIQNPNMLTGGLSAAIENEFLMPLNDLIDEYMPHYKAIRESNDAYLRNSRLSDGTIPMAYSFNKEGAGINLGPVVRQDWLDELGLESPVTYDDYHDVLSAFKNDKGADAALWIPYTGSTAGYLVAGFGTGIGIIYKDGEVLYGPVTDEYREFLTMMNSWYEEGLVYHDFATYTASDQYAPDEIVNNNRCGIFYSTVAKISETEGVNAGEGFALSAIPDAVKNPGDKNHVCHNYSLVLGVGTGISTQCENPELAAQWLNFQYTQKGFLLNNYGEENVSYTLDENGDPHFTDLITSNPDGLPLPIAIEKYACMSGPFVVDYTRMYGGYSETQLAASGIWSDTSDNEWLVDAVPLETDENAAYSAASSEVSTYIQGEVAKFIMGESDLESGWDEYVETAMSLGVQDMIDIYSDAVARYYAD